MRYPRNMVPFKPEHLFYLAANARQDEREQWEYFHGKPYDPRDVTAYVLRQKGPAFTVMGCDGNPAVAGGYFYVSPGVWQSWMLGTPLGWILNWRSITKATRWLVWAMFQIGAKRLETFVQPSRARTCEWYCRAMGLQRESDSLYAREV